MNKDISENLDYRIKLKSDNLDTTRKIAKLSNLLKSIKKIKMPIQDMKNRTDEEFVRKLAEQKRRVDEKLIR